jgi:hypothetical protein
MYLFDNNNSIYFKRLIIMKTTITQLGKQLFVLIIVLFSGQNSFAQFTPGEGGNLPAFTPFTTPEGKIGGLYVISSQRENNAFYTGTRSIVDMKFPAPSQFGADSYTLQYSTDGISWNNYQNNGSDLTTTGDNFSLNLYESYKLRLLVNGGAKNGFTSNEVYAPLSSVDTRFAGWFLDESMYLSGVMTPWVGRGLSTSVTVRKLSDETGVTGGLTYQWYRVNPATYEMAAIPDSTKLTYTTTQADLGYLLAMRATGDEVNAGGFIQIMSGTQTVMANLAYVSNVSSDGFTLNLNKTVSSLSAYELILYDKTYTPVALNSVTQGANSAICNIVAALDTAKSPYQLQNVSSFWRIATEFKTPMFTDLMQGLSFSYTITTVINDVSGLELNVYPIPAKDKLCFKANDPIGEAIVFNVKGEKLLQSTFNNNEGVINTSKLGNGIYILKLITSSGVLNKKIQILK